MFDEGDPALIDAVMRDWSERINADADEVAVAIRAAHRGELQLDPAIARGLMSRFGEAEPDDPSAALTPRELDELLRRLLATFLSGFLFVLGFL